MEKLSNSIIRNFLLKITGGIEHFLLERASKDPRKTQESTLRSILKKNRDTEFGTAHDFKYILQASDDTELYRRYREKVSTCSYGDHKPLTDTLHARNASARLNKLWFYNAQKLRPLALNGKVFSIVSPSSGETDSQRSGSAREILYHITPAYIRKNFVTPPEVSDIKDFVSRYYTLMRMSIEHNTTLCTATLPHSVMTMQGIVDKYFDLMCDDIENGTLSDTMTIPEEIRRACSAYLSPNPERAAELRELKRKHGRVLPCHYWPEMQIFTCWLGGSMKEQNAILRESLPANTLRLEAGYSIEECDLSFPLDETGYNVLFPHMYYAEFVEESDINSSDPTYVQLHELVPGKRYYPIVTTQSGLFRCSMHSIIEVAPTPFVNTPRIFLVHKQNDATDITGENLHQQQFIDAVHAAVESTKTACKFFVGFIDKKTSTYHFYFEFADRNVSQGITDRFTTYIDYKLKKDNREYSARRNSNRILAPKGHRLTEFAHEKYMEMCAKGGSYNGEYMIDYLMDDDKAHELFKQLVIN